MATRGFIIHMPWYLGGFGNGQGLLLHHQPVAPPPDARAAEENCCAAFGGAAAAAAARTWRRGNTGVGTSLSRRSVAEASGHLRVRRKRFAFAPGEGAPLGHGWRVVQRAMVTNTTLPRPNCPLSSRAGASLSGSLLWTRLPYAPAPQVKTSPSAAAATQW